MRVKQLLSTAMALVSRVSPWGSSAPSVINASVTGATPPGSRRRTPAAVDNVPHAAPGDGVAEQRALHILLVEDAADNRLLIQSYLKRTPYQIDIAEHGGIAVEKFATGAYDLVLMDMQMPVMDGYAATQAIRVWEAEQWATSGHSVPTPIIALTAYVLPEELRKSLDAGCTAHLTKPINKAALLETIQTSTQYVTACQV